MLRKKTAALSGGTGMPDEGEARTKVTARLPLREGSGPDGGQGNGDSRAGPPAGSGPRAERGAGARYEAKAPVIQTHELTKRYPRGVVALDGLTVAFAPGITGLVGANGAGKSTLIKILLGLLPPTSGRATVLGRDITTDAERIRMSTGYMPEHDCLPADVTATEFITHLGRMSGLPPTAAKERGAESLRHVGLYEERYRLIGTYSTGMKQRVKLAQALVGDPGLLLLDEPTTGLDPAGRVSMLDLIRRIGYEFGISIVVSSHLLGEVEQICDHLVAIDGGHLLRSDTMTTITQVSQVLAVEVDEGAGALAAELARRGFAPQASGRAVLVPIDGDATYDVVRDAVADLGLPLNRLEQQRARVEELFRDDESHGDGAVAAGAPGEAHSDH
jgi:ABC-2 type transport system ATP-binding protein